MRVTSANAFHADINIRPLVDVCLVLLIIFLVVTPLLVNGVPVELPMAGTAQATPQRPMQITINADRTLYIDSSVLRAEQLDEELQRRHDAGARPVVVRADKRLVYGDVVTVLDACRRAGFADVGLAAERLRD